MILVALVCVTTTALTAEPIELNLWPDRAPGETGDAGPERVLDEQPGKRKVIRLTDVSKPTLTVYRPAAEKANGCAVVICPGGGYHILAMDLEGTEIAQWLNSIGVTAVVVKYRVPRRDKEAPHKAPMQDAQRALRLVRKNASAWGIDRDRIGMLGFSAGGHLTVMTGLYPDEVTYPKVDDADDLSARPDFLVPIYAAYLGDPKDDQRLGAHIKVTDETPPMFLAVTQDDAKRGLHAALLFAELTKKGVPAEVHVYTSGGHGYGLRESDDPVSTWHHRCAEWLRRSGWLARVAESPPKSKE